MLLLISPLRALTFGDIDFDYKSKMIIAFDAFLISMILVGYFILNVGGGRFVATLCLKNELMSYNQFRIFTGYVIPLFYGFGLGLQMVLPLCREFAFLQALDVCEPFWLYHIREYIKSVIKFCVTMICISGCAELLPAGLAFLQEYVLGKFVLIYIFIVIITFLLRNINLTHLHRIWLATLGFILIFFVIQAAQVDLISGRVFKIDFRKECI